MGEDERRRDTFKRQGGGRECDDKRRPESNLTHGKIYDVYSDSAAADL